MPSLDRRIVVRLTTTTRNEFGEEESAVTDLPLWSTRVDLNQRDKAEAGGQLTTVARTYIVRFTNVLNDAIVSQLEVIDGGDVLSATNVTEATRLGERRKFLRIETSGEVAP